MFKLFKFCNWVVKEILGLLETPLAFVILKPLPTAKFLVAYVPLPVLAINPVVLKLDKVFNSLFKPKVATIVELLTDKVKPLLVGLSKE